MTSGWSRAAAVTAGLAGLAGPLVAGCGGSGGPAGAAPAASSAARPADQHVVIAGTDGLRFQPMTVRVRTGTVRITLTDMGAYPHNIVIPGLGVRSATVTGDPGAAKVTFTVTFRHSGRYRFHCQYHQSAGMTGVFVVS
jgi:plastocyanin